MGLIAIGDIHGCARTLDHLLEVLAPTPEDHLVFIGDYIDRGMDSKGVIDRLIALKERQSCTFLRGNHEAFLLSFLETGDFRSWGINGGQATLKSYGGAPLKPNIPNDHIAFFHQTVLYYDTPDFFFVHAGLRPDLTIAENLDLCDEETFLWTRGHLNVSTRVWEKTVICGHTPFPEPLVLDNLINIDTGCVYYLHPAMGHLTAMRLPEQEFVQVVYRG